MGERLRKRVVKRGLFWLITRGIAVGIVLSCMYAIYHHRPGFGLIILAFSLFYTFFLLFQPMVWGYRTAARIKEKDFHVDAKYYDKNCELMIDIHKGRIAVVWFTNPFKLQILDAAQLVDAKITKGLGLPNKKTANKIGVRYRFGWKKYNICTFQAYRSNIVLASKDAKLCIMNAEIIRSKLLMARDVALRYKV